jgi:nitroreductase
MSTDVLTALNWRYATQEFDSSKKVSEADLNYILESARLSPSSLGIEPWKFIVVENSETRSKLREAGYNQAKITDASHLIIIARRTDVRENISRELLERTATAQNRPISELGGLSQMLNGAISSRDETVLTAWITAQTYIPLGIMIETASLLKIDNAPMEGFNRDAVGAILGLTNLNLSSVSMLALGYRSPTDKAAKRPKARRTFEEVTHFVK